MTTTLEQLRARKSEIEALAAQYGVHNIRVFGSVARGDDTAESDIDLLVDLEKGKDLFDLVGFKQDMDIMMAREVDVVPESFLYHRLKPIVAREAEIL